MIPVWLIYRELSPGVCFSPGSSTLTEIEKNISDSLSSEYKKIQSLSPLIRLGDTWFRYDVEVVNFNKFAFVVDKQNIYSESVVNIVWETQNGPIITPYGSKTFIAQGVSLEQIPSLITGYNIETEKGIGIEIPPNTQVKIQTNTSWPICISVSPQKNYLPFIYFVFLVFLVGLLALVKEISIFINKELREYLHLR